MIYRLHRKQFLSASIEEVWAYFSNPKNLNEITPPDLHFEIIAGADEPMYEGQIIEYRVQFVPGWRSVWLTEIAHVRPGEYFVDEQRLGPYRFWYHEHRFRPQGNGVWMTDHVTYIPPFAWLGDVVHALWIHRRLEQIFDYRARRIAELFGGGR